MTALAETSSVNHNINLYDDDFNMDKCLDLSYRDIKIVPELNGDSLCALYLQGNKLTELPEDFFPSLPNLTWLDIRDNQLTTLPSTIGGHGRLTHLLLQNNKITSLPNDLGTLPHLKVLQCNGNPLIYPPKAIIEKGVEKVLEFLLKNHFDEVFDKEDNANDMNHQELDSQSFNSITETKKTKSKGKTGLSVQLKEKVNVEDCDDEKKTRKKPCPRLTKCIAKNITHFYTSHKKFVSRRSQLEKLREQYLKDKAIKKHRELMIKQEKILQDRRNLSLLADWRQNYRKLQVFANSDAKLDPDTFPYGTDPEYLTLLSREDIEKDLPDKYKKRLVRRSRPTVPRGDKGDVRLALKIKQLFDNLEAIDVKRRDMTPRTEQKVLLGEIQKISEIKQKLMELSVSNKASVITE